tara:strand:- start:346 stop:552 length:207 start_codon:yes stop_codon:yes gene_type:complete
MKKDGTFWEYIKGNKQKRRLGAITHGFALLWGGASIAEGGPWYLGLIPLPILVVYWIMSYRNYTGKTI